jgi:phosphate transport system permease protein
MAVTLAAGGKPNLSINPAEGMQTMTAFIVQVSRGETPEGSTPYYTLFAVGMTLFVMTFIANMAAVWLVKRFRKVYH